MRHLGALLGSLLLIGQAHAQAPAGSAPGATKKPAQSFDELRQQLEEQRAKQPAGASGKTKTIPTNPCVVNAKLPQCALLK